jgi:hypothetical protein
MRIDVLHAAAALRVVSQAPRPCSLCGVLLRSAVLPDDTFGPVDASGSQTGTDNDVAHLFDPAANWLGATSPYDYLVRLDAALTEALRVKRTETTWLYDRTIREYSALKVRLDMGMSFHCHQMPSDWDPAAWAAAYAAGIRPPCPPDLPHHCGRPAHLRPSGWYCRGCKALLTDETAKFTDKISA